MLAADIVASVSALTIHSDQWPVCFVKIDGDMTPSDFEGYIASFNAFYEKKERFSVITFLKSLNTNADIGRRVGTWFGLLGEAASDGVEGLCDARRSRRVHARRVEEHSAEDRLAVLISSRP